MMGGVSSLDEGGWVGETLKNSQISVQDFLHPRAEGPEEGGGGGG